MEKVERYPKAIPITVNDFNNCGLAEILDNARRDEYSSFHQELSAAAKQLIDDNKLAEGKVLWLFADACSMVLEPSSFNEPLRPFFISDRGRTAIPDDFEPDDLTFFESVVQQISNPKLNARISDILWLCLKPKKPEYALMAIDNYCQIDVNNESWKWNGRSCYERAIQLCMMLRNGAGNRLREIEAQLIDVFEQPVDDDYNLKLWIADVLFKYKLGGSKHTRIFEILEKLGQELELRGDLFRSRDHLNAACEWCNRAGEQEKLADLTILVAESWVKEAVAQQTLENPSHILAANHYQNAIHKFRQIPAALRDSRNVNSRIEEIRNRMNIAGSESLKEMKRLSTGAIDIRDLIDNARKAVTGRERRQALLNLANITQGAKVDKIRSTAEEMIRNHPLQSMFATTYISGDGRVIARRPGLDIDSSENEAVVWSEMVKNFMMELGLKVQGSIWPALEIIRQEHWIRESDFMNIARQSTIVPPDRASFISLGLFYGYDHDFATALHLLIPQIEHLVRYHLKQIGETTTSLDSNGIENEVGLSKLMENSKVNDLFGEDLSFELKAIFCDPYGPNLRNELAHGLLEYEYCFSPASIYAWWLCLRIVYNTYWNNVVARQKTQITGEDEQKPVVKKTSSGICHDQSSRSYKRIKNFESFGSIEECLECGGRLPK